MIDVKKLAPVKTITLATVCDPLGTRMPPDGKHLYVSTGRSKMVLILDTTKNEVVGSIEAGPRSRRMPAPMGHRFPTAHRDYICSH